MKLLLLAAGSSRRFGSDKLFALINGKPAMLHCLRTLHSHPAVSEIYIAAHLKNAVKIKQLVSRYKFGKVKKVLFGGATRAESVLKLLRIFPLKKNEKIIIHNAANPFVSGAELDAAIAAVRGTVSGAAVGRSVTSTLKKIVRGGAVAATVDRKDLWEVETPQVVNGRHLQTAYKKLGARAWQATDDIGILEQAGYKTKITPASPRNRKLTHAHDADFFSVPVAFTAIGQDAHCFDTKGTCVLAGVTLPGVPKLAADSDGDVVFHALANALSSALGGGSFGPVAAKLCRKGIRDSARYVDEFVGRLGRTGMSVIFCSVSLQAVSPRLERHLPRFKKNISKLLSLAPDSVGISVFSGNSANGFDGIHCTALVSFRDDSSIRKN